MRVFRLGKISVPRFSYSVFFVFLGLFGITAAIIGVALILQGRNNVREVQYAQAQQEINRLLGAITAIKSEDQYARNDRLQEEIANIQKTYRQASAIYEELTDLRVLTRDTRALDERFALTLGKLAARQWATASADFTLIGTDIAAAKTKIAASFAIPANVTENNTAPNAGYSRQVVQLDLGEYLVDIIAADMGTTRVIVDTASDATCTRDCPVLSLGEYVARNNAFAGINGSYFCPADYPSCSEKKNAFDTLLMNKNKVYFNSDNNVYSTVPAVIFLSGSMRFVGRSLEWGRDTSPDGVIANQPLLVSGGNIVFGGDTDPKKGSKGSRGFVGNKGTIAYIGVVHNATVAEVAHVLKTMGLENALNLDSGGSTALWSGGYKAGPGRGVPNAILFVRK
jgi:hypothetical protein